MKQQFLPRALRLRLGLFEASSCRVPGVVGPVPQRVPMAVDTGVEAASFADYLRKHNLTETLAVFLKEAKLEQQNGGTNPAEIEATAAAGKASKKRKPGAEAKVPDPGVVASVFNTLSAGTGEDKTSSGILESGEKLKKKKLKKDPKVDEKGVDLVDWKGVFGKEGEGNAKSKDATVDIADGLPITVETVETEAEVAAPKAPAKGPKKEKKKDSQVALPESALENTEAILKGDEEDKTVDVKGTDEVVQSEKPSKKTAKKGKKSGNEDVQSVPQNTQTSGGNAESSADKDGKLLPNVAVVPEAASNLQQIALDGSTVKAKGKRAKKDKGAAPGEPMQAEGGNGYSEPVAKTGATTRSRGKKQKEVEAATEAEAEKRKLGEVPTGPPIQKEMELDSLKSDEPRAAATNEGKKPGKGKKEKKVKVSDVENGSLLKDAVATQVGSLKTQEDVEMICSNDPIGEDVVGQRKKMANEAKKGKVADDGSISRGIDAVSGAGIVHAERDGVDSTTLKFTEVETTQKEISVKDQEQNGQQSGADPTPSKKKGKKAKDRGAEVLREAERDGVDTTNLKSNEPEIPRDIPTKDQEHNGQQLATPSKKKGKKAKDHGAEPPPEPERDGVDTTKMKSTDGMSDDILLKAQEQNGQQPGDDPTLSKKKAKDPGSDAPPEPANVSSSAVEGVPANGTQVVGKNKRKRNETDDGKEAAGEIGKESDDPGLAVPSKKAKKGDMKTSATAPKTFFQRVDPSKVEILDPRLENNSYWSKDGADNGWGAKAQEVLGKVRGKDFRHEKTKKKRGSYKGGAIDNQSHSVKFSYPDED